MTEDQIKHMVDRFLMWRLPKPWHPDNGISYQRPNYAHGPAEHDWPVGTNLFDATQTDAMVRHMIEGLPVEPLRPMREWQPSRDELQDVVSEWAIRCFGNAEALGIKQRAIRLLEEAVEAYQAAGATADMARKMIDHVFAQPSGELSQELGGVGVCVLALAQAAGFSAAECERLEIERVTSKSPEYFAERNANKNRLGFNAALPDLPEAP